mgnify:CR=1 FL=1
MEKLIILDSTDNIVYIKNYDHSEWEDILQFLSEHGFNIENCSWMLVDKVTLNID